MKTLIFGRHGQLASCLYDLNSSYTYLGKEDLDISEGTKLERFLNQNQADIIVNLSAYTAVDKAEKEESLAHKINAEAVDIMARSATYFIHISTDYVFDGLAKSAIKEESTCQPINAYGRSKRSGELESLKNSNTLIFRTSWLYSEYGNNFLKTMLRIANEKKQVSVVSDQVAAPTYAGDLAAIIEQCITKIKHCPKGIYHFCNDGMASWHDFAKAIFDITNADIDLNKIDTASYQTPAKRPLFTLLDNSKIKRDFNIQIPTWQESLKKCLQKISY